MRARLAIFSLVTLAVPCGRPALAQVTGMPRDSVALDTALVEHETVLRSVRVGYLHRNGGSAAGGVTLGYREANGFGIPGGLEIGLPFIWQAPRAWMHLDARYVLYDRTATWNWRFEIRVPLARKPLVAGFGMDFKPQHDEDNQSFARYSVLIGVLR